MIDHVNDSIDCLLNLTEANERLQDIYDIEEREQGVRAIVSYNLEGDKPANKVPFID